MTYFGSEIVFLIINPAPFSQADRSVRFVCSPQPLPPDSPNNTEHLMCIRQIGSGSRLLPTMEPTRKGQGLRSADGSGRGKKKN